MPASASRANSSGIASKRAEKNTGPRLSIRKRAASASASARGTDSQCVNASASWIASQRVQKRLSVRPSVRKRPSGNSGTASQRADKMETHLDAADNAEFGIAYKLK